jgi:hypothetical protein
MRSRIAFIAMLVTLTVGAIAVPAAARTTHAAASSSKAVTPAPLYTVHITGVAKNGKKFTGKYGINRFIVSKVKGKKAVYAIGTLTGRVAGHRVVRKNVMIPASLTGASAVGLPARSAAVSCPVLHLVLGPINLNLLGLKVTLGGGPTASLPIVLDISAVPGPGNLLGNLLCNLTSALNTGGLLSQLTGQLSQLSATLNSLVSLLGGL